MCPLDFDRSPRTPCTNASNVVNCRKQSKSGPPPLPKFPPPLCHRRQPNFRALSANVQRLISHSNTSLHSNDMNDNQTVDDPNPDSVKKRLSIVAQLNVTPTTNGSKFKHPLSKNTDKLTQFVSDLVIDDSDGGYVTPPENLYENRDNNLYEDINLNDHDYEDAEDVEDDMDKTPINECSTFKFDVVQDQINGNEDDDVYDLVGNDPNWIDTTNEQNQVNDEQRTSLKNTSFIHSQANKTESIPNDSSHSGSAQNSPTLSQKSTDSETTKTTKSQLFAIKAQVIEQQNVKHPPVSNQSADLSITEKEIETNEKTTATNEKTTANHKENGQITIDLKRTKIRPLSSVSISSTSSSSSSASDEHSSNQNAISYLASVESLADHSENELAILSSSLTVTERACLEIIDSERSYVNDLGQVIKG